MLSAIRLPICACSAPSCRSAIVAQARLPRSSLPRRWAHVVTNTGFRHVSLAHGSSRAGKGSGALRRDLSLRAISPAWPSKAISSSAASRSIQSPSRPCSLGERSSELEGGALTQGERRRRRACGQPLSDGGPACAAPDAAAGDELELPPQCRKCLKRSGVQFRIAYGTRAERAEARARRIEKLRAKLSGGPLRVHPRGDRDLERRRPLELSLRRAMVVSRLGLLEEVERWRGPQK